MSAEYIKYNTCEEDYIERCGAVEELTVTITLSEYRGLIKANTEFDIKCERLAAENDELQERVDMLSKALLAQHPEALGKMAGLVRDMFGAADDEEADDNETAGGK